MHRLKELDKQKEILSIDHTDVILSFKNTEKFN